MKTNVLDLEYEHYNYLIKHGFLDQETRQRLSEYMSENQVGKILLFGEGKTAQAIRDCFADRIIGSIDSASVSKINDIEFDTLFLALSPTHYEKVSTLIRRNLQKSTHVLRIFKKPPQGHKTHSMILEKRRNEQIRAFREKHLSSVVGGSYSRDKEYILKKIDALNPWYHCIDLGHGIVTPGYNWNNIWDPIRKMMDHVDYNGKKVIDLASWDGMWAFEAEKRGAFMVVSTDARKNGYENLLFAREVLHSNVVPLCNVPVQFLAERLQIIGMPERYDIVQHYGLFYHLRDPLLSLKQCRKIISDNGLLLLETAFVNDDEQSCMWFSGVTGDYHLCGPSDTWIPTLRCLKEVLIRSFFMPVNEKHWQFLDNGEDKLGRISIMATPIPEEEGEKVDRDKVFGSQ